MPLLGTKRTINDIGSWDMNTSEYWHDLGPVLPSSGAALKNYVDNQLLVVRKLSLYPADVALLREKLGFDELLLQIYDPNCAVCGSVSDCLVNLATTFVSISNDSENSMIAYVDAVMRLFEVFVNQPRRRNVSNKISSKFKPDYMSCDGARGDVYLVGGEKPRDVYVPEVIGKDPAAENIHKTRFEDWKQCYGNLPYIFAYDAVGSSGRVDFNFGVLDSNTRSFVNLYSGDIAHYRNRAEFVLVLFKLLPVLKAVITGAASAVTPMYQQLQSWSHGAKIRKIVAMLYFEGESIVEKKWEWMIRSGEPDRAAAEAYEMCVRLQSVFQVLDAAGTDHEGFRLFKSVNCGSDRNIHRTGIKMDGNNPVASGDNEPIGLKGFFSPRALPISVDANDESYLTLVLNVARCVSFLHKVNIVHNDIRRQNIGMAPDQSEGNLSIVLFDYDDAYCLTEEVPVCPPLIHLSLDEHPKKSHENHGKEVDVWAIGHLLSRGIPGAALGNEIKENFESLTVEQVIDRLTKLTTK